MKSAQGFVRFFCGKKFTGQGYFQEKGLGAFFYAIL
jgi:hypothetical protein